MLRTYTSVLLKLILLSTGVTCIDIVCWEMMIKWQMMREIRKVFANVIIS